MTNPSVVLPGNRLSDLGIKWGWLLALGILITALGVIGLGMTYWLTIVATVWLGAFALIGGIAQIVDAFHHKGWKSITWHVVIGVIYVIAGVVLIATPVTSAFWLTLFIAISLAVTGIMRIVMAFQIREKGRIWIAVLLSGLISVILGIMIYGTIVPPTAEALATTEGQLEWLRSWGWIIGLFVAIEFIMEGAALIAIALGVKKAQESTVA